MPQSQPSQLQNIHLHGMKLTGQQGKQFVTLELSDQPTGDCSQGKQAITETITTDAEADPAFITAVTTGDTGYLKAHPEARETRNTILQYLKEHRADRYDVVNDILTYHPDTPLCHEA